MKHFLLLCGLCFLPLTLRAVDAPGFTVQVETVLEHDGADFQWMHPRAAAMPGGVLMTLNKLLEKKPDFYSGLLFMTRSRADGAWSEPALPQELERRTLPDGVIISVADVTPGWHAKTGKLIAIGCRVRYNPAGKQLEDVKRAHQTVYAVFDPKTSKWTPWQVLELPAEEQFNFARNACSQWLVQPDGTLLVPLYIGPGAKQPFSTTVAHCRFDGATLTYLRHGSVLRLNVARGLYEPSLVQFGGRYLLTMRNDLRGYVAVSDDGLTFSEPEPWRFDEGTELGSYNTQQHWLAHSRGLFLVYTRRGAGNDHIYRHRAPLFMAQVNPETQRVLRATEQVIIRERGADMGNFGVAAISPAESWITASENMLTAKRERGADGTTFVARILWAEPNQLVPP